MAQIPPASGPSTQFTTTHWSLLALAGHGDTAAQMAALEKLCSAYWYPLYAYLRRRAYSEHDAQDLTQGFFEHLLEHQVFGSVAPGRGKFRSFLLASLNHFLADERDRQRAQKRGGGQPVISFDAHKAEQRYQLEPRDTETPEKLFDRRCAITLIDGALARLEQEFISAGKGTLFEHLRGLLVEGAERRPYAEVAQQLGMTEEAVKKAAQRLRHRYQEVIRDEIAQTVSTTAEIEEELRHLWLVLCGD